MEFKLISPLAVYLPRKTMKDKKMILNYNVVNGLHFIVYNLMKVEYTEKMKDQMQGLKFNRISLVFKYFKPTARLCDRANIYSTHEKFFCDALVKHGVIKDDNDEFIKESRYLSVELDRKNPRVEITISEV